MLPPSSSGAFPQHHADEDAITESLFASIEHDLTDHQILALSSIFDKLLIPALDLVDRGKVLAIPSPHVSRGGSAVVYYVVQSATDPSVSYTVFWQRLHKPNAGAASIKDGQEQGHDQDETSTTAPHCHARRSRLIPSALRQPPHCPCPAFTVRAYGPGIAAKSAGLTVHGQRAAAEAASIDAELRPGEGEREGTHRRAGQALTASAAAFSGTSAAQGSPFLMCKHLLAARLADRLGKSRPVDGISWDHLVAALAGRSVDSLGSIT